MGNEVVNFGLKSINVWPQDLEAETCGDPTIRKITFNDTQEYHPRLAAKILELEEHHRLRKRYARGSGGTKILHLQQWLSTEAELITARATALFKRGAGR